MANYKKYFFILLAFILSVSCTTKRKPNIIYILADDLGYGDLGCYGQKVIKTPEIDKMASQGMRFTSHYAGSTVCAPSRCTLMTGLHTGHSRVRGNATQPLLPEDVTVAELLQKAGYKTGLVGKWGLGEAQSTGTPNKKGFDYFFGYLNQIHAHNSYPAYLWKNDVKFPLENEVEIIKTGYAKDVGGVARKKVTHSHDLFTKEALDFVETNKNSAFFLYLAYTMPHANNEGESMGQIGMEVPELGIYKDKDWSKAQKAHAAMISYLDKDVGKLLAKLKALGLDQNTLVIFTSDNGPHAEGGADPNFFDSNGSLKGIKRDLYEGGIRVPMITWWPSRIESGSESTHISAFWDFLPTACDIAGVPVPAWTDGISFLPALRNEEQREHDYLYWEFQENAGSQAIRKQNWKAVKNNMSNDFDAPVELYDLDKDIAEDKNIAEDYPDVLQELDGWMKTGRTPSDVFQFEFEKK